MDTSPRVEVSVSELRTHTGQLVSRAEHGESLTITVNGRPVARLEPLPKRRRFISWGEIQEGLQSSQS
jgi:prevent-host-death family protein